MAATRGGAVSSVTVLATVLASVFIASARATAQSCWQACPPSSAPSSEACGVHSNDVCTKLLAQVCEPCGLLQLCSTLGTSDDGSEDVDWYEFTLSSPMQVMIYCASEAPVRVKLAHFNGPTSCASIASFDPDFTVDPCELGMGFACLDAGTWWFTVEPAYPNAIGWCNGDADFTYWVGTRANTAGDESAASPSVTESISHDSNMQLEFDLSAANFIEAGDDINAVLNLLQAAGQAINQAHQASNACGPPAQPAQTQLTAALNDLGSAVLFCNGLDEQIGLAAGEGLGGKIQMDEALSLLDQIEQQLDDWEIFRAGEKAITVRDLHVRCDEKLKHVKEIKPRQDAKREAAKALLDALKKALEAIKDFLESLGGCSFNAVQATNQANFMVTQAAAILADDSAVQAGMQHAEAAANSLRPAEISISHVIAVLSGCACPQCGVCMGDLNQDQIVDGGDLGILLAAWGTPEGNLNEDGTTDGGDLGILLAAWGPCP